MDLDAIVLFVGDGRPFMHRDTSPSPSLKGLRRGQALLVGNSKSPTNPHQRRATAVFTLQKSTSKTYIYMYVIHAY